MSNTDSGQAKLNEFALQFFRTPELIAEIVEARKQIVRRLYLVHCSIKWSEFLRGEEVVFTLENLRASTVWQRIGPSNFHKLDFVNQLILDLVIQAEGDEPSASMLVPIPNPAPIPPGTGNKIKKYKVIPDLEYHYAEECYGCGTKREIFRFRANFCEGCKILKYCCFECQEHYWPTHSQICADIAALFNANVIKN